MNPRTRLYLQKTTILLTVFLALRFLLPIILPFFLAWATVCCLNSIREKYHLRLLPLTISYLVIFILLTISTAFCTYCLLHEPCLELLPVCRNYWNRLSEYLDWIPEALSGRLAELLPFIFTGCFGIFLYLISVLLIAKDWKKVQSLLQKLPFSAPVSRAGHRITQSVRGWVRAQFKIMLIVSAQCAVGYYLLHIPGFLFWALLTGLVDALPVFGTGTVFIPWIAIVLLQGNYMFALWLFVLFLLTWLTRELLEPKLLGDGLGLLPICFLMSVIVGLKLFGALGLFTGPFGVLLVRELWAELERSAPPEKSWASSSGDEGTSS